jgi:hypothetical protein
VQLVQLVHKGVRVRLAHRAASVHRVPLALKVKPEFKARRASKDIKVSKVRSERKAFKELPAVKAFKVRKDHRA